MIWNWRYMVQNIMHVWYFICLISRAVGTPRFPKRKICFSTPRGHHFWYIFGIYARFSGLYVSRGFPSTWQLVPVIAATEFSRERLWIPREGPNRLKSLIQINQPTMTHVYCLIKFQLWKMTMSKNKHEENLALQVPDSKKCSLEPSKYSWLEQPEV